MRPLPTSIGNQDVAQLLLELHVISTVFFFIEKMDVKFICRGCFFYGTVRIELHRNNEHYSTRKSLIM
jgi:hypothetical protein